MTAPTNTGPRVPRPPSRGDNTGPRVPRPPSRGDNTGTLDPTLAANLPTEWRDLVHTSLTRMYVRGWRAGVVHGMFLSCSLIGAALLLGTWWRAL